MTVINLEEKVLESIAAMALVLADQGIVTANVAEVDSVVAAGARLPVGPVKAGVPGPDSCVHGRDDGLGSPGEARGAR